MHIVITGASSGIGAAVARRFARHPNARLTLVARRRALLDRLAAELDVPCHVAAVDLSIAPAPTDWLDDAIAAHGPVDVLVNNAGIQVIGPTATVDADAGERSLAVNLHAPLRLIQAVLPSMLERDRGSIVNIASMAAIAPTPAMAYYNASKAGIAAASEALAGELRRTGVGVLTVYPGIVSETDMAQKALATYESSRMLRLQPTGTAERLAELIDRGVARHKARLIYPRANVLARWFPGTTRWIMDRFTPALAAI
jgi:short-subunit dehydrogenase